MKMSLGQDLMITQNNPKIQKKYIYIIFGSLDLRSGRDF